MKVDYDALFLLFSRPPFQKSTQRVMSNYDEGESPERTVKHEGQHHVTHPSISLFTNSSIRHLFSLTIALFLSSASACLSHFCFTTDRDCEGKGGTSSKATFMLEVNFERGEDSEIEREEMEEVIYDLLRSFESLPNQ